MLDPSNRNLLNQIRRAILIILDAIEDYIGVVPRNKELRKKQNKKKE